MDERKRNINRLKAGASYFGCGGYLSKLDTLHRLDIYNKLGFERLSRKNSDINHIFEECQQNWQQTFYTMLMRTMGGVDNKEAFTELARRVPYAILLREREVAANVEALLIGASGLLTLYPHDEYILNLKRNFSYLSTKYSITAMEASAWRLKRIYPNNHPILRLSQVASFITYTREMMDRMLACTSGDDVYNLFSCQTLPYWQTHYIPASTSPSVAKRTGRTKTDLLAINLVVQMQFAYSSYTGNERLYSRALGLLESLPAEKNSIIAQWNSFGPLARTAFDSQALLQLSFEYCRDRRCEECLVGKQILDKTAPVESLEEEV
ncbi:MAG: DUF2851 family protein [Alistipes sp.]|jgi:hypothetical protein|nr:DUF2851 family protein [Alistipes sp.]MBQ5703618.1 DUF2851 family protein [Alistipes sp.]